MNASRDALVLATICGVMLLLSLAGIVFDFTTLMAFHPNLDGILLLSVCLIFALLFAILLFFLARAEGWLPSRKAAPEKGK